MEMPRVGSAPKAWRGVGVRRCPRRIGPQVDCDRFFGRATRQGVFLSEAKALHVATFHGDATYDDDLPRLSSEENGRRRGSNISHSPAASTRSALNGEHLPARRNMRQEWARRATSSSSESRDARERLAPSEAGSVVKNARLYYKLLFFLKELKDTPNSRASPHEYNCIKVPIKCSYKIFYL